MEHSPPDLRWPSTRSGALSNRGDGHDPVVSDARRLDVSREPAAMHDRYGRSEMGQVLLLSRR